MINSYNSIIKLIYRLLSVKGIGNVQANRLLHSISGEGNINLAEEQILAYLSETQGREFMDSSIDLSLLDNNVKFISILDDTYPIELERGLSVRMPPVLAYRGNLDLLLMKKIAFSGSRQVSEKGMDITRDIIEQLFDSDICVVSGYAAGVDFIAHSYTLKNNGYTIIVLPEGINGFRIRKELCADWNWNRTLVISEFLPNAKWTVGRAMQRNKTLIGLSDISIVIEAGVRGGSFDAGIATLEQGKYLFAPQYSIPPESALGNRILIDRGAFPLRKNRFTNKVNLTLLKKLLNTRNKYSLFED